MGKSKNNITKKEDLDTDLERLWDEVPPAQETNAKESSWEAFASSAFPEQDDKPQNRYPIWAVAAVIAALLAIGSVSVYFNTGTFSKSEFHVVENATANLKEIQLPDGSTVELEPSSKITYADNFKENRQLKLSGTAFFNVREDKNHPFSVQCSKATTTVLGTSFTVAEEEQGKLVRVRLYNGSVRMNVAGETKNWILAPGNEFVLNDMRVSIHNFERFIDFEAAEIKDIIAYIESNYDYEFIVPEQVLQQRLTLRINKKERFLNVVTIIANMYNLKYEVDEDLKIVKFKS